VRKCLSCDRVSCHVVNGCSFEFAGSPFFRCCGAVNGFRPIRPARFYGYSGLERLSVSEAALRQVNPIPLLAKVHAR
jgi:hypothetical protein